MTVEITKPNISPLTFLVIEDREIIRKVLMKMLLTSGHRVCEASGGREGVEQFKHSSFDAVFTDLSMPEMTGWEVAREVKKLDPSCIVVFITGFTQQVSDSMKEECGVSYILTKPFRMEGLMDVVQKISELRSGGKPLERALSGEIQPGA